ncbi:MAG: PRC-barrel domain-containing protein [Bradyrhizobium sp.]
MPKTILSAAIAAVLAASMPAAFAQTNAAGTPPAPAVGHPALANHVMPGQLRFTDMNGATVYDAQNNNIGDINNVVLDREGRVAAVVIKTGAFLGIGGKNVAIGMNDLKVANDNNGKPRFSVTMTKEQLKSAQAYDATPPRNSATGSSTPPREQKQK